MREYSKACPKCRRPAPVFALLCGHCLSAVPVGMKAAVLASANDAEFLRRAEAALASIDAPADDLRIPRDYRQAVESAPPPRFQCISCDQHFSAADMTGQVCRPCMDDVPADIRRRGPNAATAWLLNPS